MYETEINDSLRRLKNQNIPVSSAIVGPHGLTFDVMGYMLTASQIVELNRENMLHPHGIREFAKTFEPTEQGESSYNVTGPLGRASTLRRLRRLTTAPARSQLNAKKHHSTRLVEAVPIAVAGIDALGQAFKENTTTIMISCHGCMYSSKHYVPKTASVTLEIPRAEPNLQPRSFNAKVVRVGRPRSVRELFKIGVVFEIPGNVWGIAYPPEDWFPYPGQTGVRGNVSVEDWEEDSDTDSYVEETVIQDGSILEHLSDFLREGKSPTSPVQLARDPAVSRTPQSRYEVALSFAGEDRAYVEQTAKALKRKGIRTFYDRYEVAALWGKDLYTHLDEIYRQRSKYTVMFISKHYATKLWTNHERKSAQARAFNESKEYILPARFDDTDVPGLLPTVGYVDLRNITPPQLADLIAKKLRSS